MRTLTITLLATIFLFSCGPRTSHKRDIGWMEHKNYKSKSIKREMIKPISVEKEINANDSTVEITTIAIYSKEDFEKMKAMREKMGEKKRKADKKK